MKRFFVCFVFLFFIFDAIAAERNSHELVEAAEKGDLKKVRSLITADADLNAPDPKEGLTPLIGAVQFGHTAIVEVLIKSGADLNRKDEVNQSTPLMWAVRKEENEEGKVTAPIEKKYDIAKLLIESGADIHVKNRWGSTALQWAADSGNLVMVQTLIERGADVNAGDEAGLTPLMVAANYEGETYLKMVQTMIKAGAKVNVQDELGVTALMKAAMNHFKTDTVRFLLSSGAEIDSKT
jgi:ankyrin repeat protein